MAFSSVSSAALSGLRVDMIRVEADVSDGLPVFQMVGYLSSEVKEASERVRTAIRNSGIRLLPKKTVINLSPATVKKRGPSFDLPIALAVLMSIGEIPDGALEGTLVLGELSLDGQIRKVNGVLPIVLEAKRAGYHTCILPKENVSEGALVENVRILGVKTLMELCLYLRGECKMTEEKPIGPQRKEEEKRSFGFEEIRGQEMVKRAAEVAVAGGHNLLLVGPPGSGKTMIAQRIPTILPELTREESMEITKIYSVMGMVDEERPLITGRPFRSVHHTATKAALIGGGAYPVPGEISLAHGGVLFLDELAEFSKPVLEVLRQPLEERQIRLTRSHGNYVFPANFMLVAALNPCPCGNYPDLSKCSCTEGQIAHYLGRISQPFLDRMDICVEAPRVKYEDLRKSGADRKREQGVRIETSAEIRTRVSRARRLQQQRYRGSGIFSNAMLGIRELETYCALGSGEERLMKQAFTNLSLTARTYHKILKMARTVADLEGEERITTAHLAEAISYRTLDKKYWGR